MLRNLRKALHIEGKSLYEAFRLDKDRLEEKVDWKTVEDGLYYDFGPEGQQLVKDQEQLSLLKSYLRVLDDKVSSNELVKAFGMKDEARQTKSVNRAQ